LHIYSKILLSNFKQTRLLYGLNALPIETRDDDRCVSLNERFEIDILQTTCEIKIDKLFYSIVYKTQSCALRLAATRKSAKSETAHFAACPYRGNIKYFFVYFVVCFVLNAIIE